LQHDSKATMQELMLYQGAARTSPSSFPHTSDCQCVSGTTLQGGSLRLDPPVASAGRVVAA